MNQLKYALNDIVIMKKRSSLVVNQSYLRLSEWVLISKLNA